MYTLTANQLEGVWAAIPTPFTASGALDTATLEENIGRYKSRGIRAIYTTDNDGEFYALELDEFRHLAQAFGQAAEAAGVQAAMGVTWSSTRGIIQRAQAALDAGVPNLHVAFPYWMPLAPSDVPRFFGDLAEAVPQSRWIHYRTHRSHILPTGLDYARWQSRHPEQFIGTKLATTDIAEIIEIIEHAPLLAHFAGEHCFVPASLAGARGVCSYWVNTLPEWTLETWSLCRSGRWGEAMRRQRKLIRWESEFVRRLKNAGHNHAVVAKARVALTNFLVDTGATRPPYYPADPELTGKLQSEFRLFWAEALEQHLSAPVHVG